MQYYNFCGTSQCRLRNCNIRFYYVVVSHRFAQCFHCRRALYFALMHDTDVVQIHKNTQEILNQIFFFVLLTFNILQVERKSVK